MQKIIYRIFNPNQTRVKKKSEKKKFFNITATQGANTRFQFARKLRNMVFKLGNTHSHSFKIPDINIDEINDD